MKKIIIIGAGKAGFIHYSSYIKLGLKNYIYFVDKNSNSKFIKIKRIYKTLEECIKENKFEKKDIIIDICTPYTEFEKIIKKCKKLGIKDIIVEKPYYAKNNKKSNIVMVENYIYSKITEEVKKFIDSKRINVDQLYINFSKNRKKDSLKNRGFNTIPTINYEIEIPHLVYMTIYLLNSNKINNIVTCSKDMELSNKRLLNHGYGLIMAKKDNTNIILESNLTSDITQKKIIVTLQNGECIEANFPLYDSKLHLKTRGTIYYYRNGKLIKQKVIEEDDNFKKFLDNSYNYFSKKCENPNKVKIEDFSKLMLEFKSSLLARK